MVLGALFCAALGIGHSSDAFCTHCAGLAQTDAQTDAATTAAAQGNWFVANAGVFVQMFIALVITFGTLLLLTRLEQRSASGRGTGSDARHGALYVLAGAGAVLLLATRPQLDEKFKEILSGQIVSVGVGDIWLLVAALVPATLLFTLFRHEFLWSGGDPCFVAAAGRRVFFWNTLLSFLLGVVICATVYIAGPLVCLGAMLLPALSAYVLAPNMRVFLLAAPLLGLLGAFVGFVFSSVEGWELAPNLPLGMSIVAAHGCILAAAKLASAASRLVPAGR